MRENQFGLDSGPPTWRWVCTFVLRFFIAIAATLIGVSSVINFGFIALYELSSGSFGDGAFAGAVSVVCAGVSIAIIGWAGDFSRRRVYLISMSISGLLLTFLLFIGLAFYASRVDFLRGIIG